MLDSSLSEKLVARVLWDSGLQDQVTLQNWDIILDLMITGLNHAFKNLGSFREEIVELTKSPPKYAEAWKFMADVMVAQVCEMHSGDYVATTAKVIAEQVMFSWHDLITTDKSFRIGVWYGLTGAIHRRMR